MKKIIFLLVCLIAVWGYCVWQRKAVWNQSSFSGTLEAKVNDRLVRFGIRDQGWGDIEKEVYDYYPKTLAPWKLKLSYDYLETVSGLLISKKTIKEILLSLHFEIIKDTTKELEVLVPTYRTDVTLEEDLIEEILRIYSYDQIPTQTLSLSIPDDVTPNFIKQEKRVRNSLVELGFDEVISLPFVRKDFLSLNTSFPDKPVSPVTILNRPSPDFEYLRMSMFPNLYEFTKKIIDERGTTSHIFEVGKVYTKKGSEYSEKRKVGIIYWEKDASFAKFKGLVDGFFQKLFIQSIKYKLVTREMPILQNSFSIHAKSDMIGIGGMYKNMYFVEIDLDILLEKEGKPKAIMWSKYPPQIEDITLLVPERTHIGDIVDCMKEEKAINDVQLVTVYDNAYTFRLWYQDEKKTLQDKEVEEVRNKILHALKKQFGATVK
jgi:phenylalanyl-tRNA synthetase beta chain